MAKFRDRIVDFRRVPANQIKPNPRNWRTHSQYQKESLTGVLNEIGIAGAVIARETEDGTLELIDGHLRSDILSGNLIPVIVLDVDEEEANTILATFDPLSELAGKDSTKLEKLLDSIKVDNTSVEKLLASLREEKPPTDKRSHKSTSTDSYASPETDFRETASVATYTIVFDDKSQLESWYEFLKWLNKNVEGSTIGQRLVSWSSESQ